MSLRAFPAFACLIFSLLLASAGAALAREEIRDFAVEIDVHKSGDITVTETIAVNVEGREINRGVFRDLPRFHTRDGVRYPYDYTVLSVTRDGAPEPYEKDHEGNATRLVIGDPDVYLDYGEHIYEIEYRVRNQVRYFEDYDEIYWNATGNYWNFPILHAVAIVRLPEGAEISQTAAYTGGEGRDGADYRHRAENGAEIFETTRALSRGEGLTVAVGFAKGAVDPPSAEDLRAEWLARNMAAMVLAAAIVLLAAFYSWAFLRFGQDPAKGPVFPRYEPPKGVSPAAAHHIYHRAFSGHQALIGTILNLGVKDAVKIETVSKKETKLIRLSASEKALAEEERTLLDGIFNRRESFTLGAGYDSAFTKAYAKFQTSVASKYGKPYFRWNAGFLILGVVLAFLACGLTVAVAVSTVGLALWHAGGMAFILLMTAWFSYLIPAPTPKGQATRTEIEGFRLYMKTAEKIYLDAAKPGTDAPPPMTVERYERFLPYAAALGVEEPWTRHFEKLIPEEAAAYHPRWAGLHAASYSSLHGLNSALVSGLSSGVSASMPQSSSSSGSGGGGFSGGGGGGGGGGGW